MMMKHYIVYVLRTVPSCTKKHRGAEEMNISEPLTCQEMHDPDRAVSESGDSEALNSVCRRTLISVLKKRNSQSGPHFLVIILI